MSEKDKPKNILVIGSTGHQLADGCKKWGEEVYIGDYAEMGSATFFRSPHPTQHQFYLIPSYSLVGPYMIVK